jgi:hypothetical protein
VAKLTIKLSNLDGTNGFKINGIDTIEGCALVNNADEAVSSLTNSTIADLSIILIMI